MRTGKGRKGGVCSLLMAGWGRGERERGRPLAWRGRGWVSIPCCSTRLPNAVPSYSKLTVCIVDYFIVACMCCWLSLDRSTQLKQ